MSGLRSAYFNDKSHPFSCFDHRPTCCFVHFPDVIVYHNQSKDEADFPYYIVLHVIFSPLNEEALKRVGKQEERKQASSYSSDLPALCQ